MDPRQAARNLELIRTLMERTVQYQLLTARAGLAAGSMALAGALAFLVLDAANPWHFAEQLPFYSIRPLYIELLAGIHRLGATYFQATRLVSSIALALIGLPIFLWMRASVTGPAWRVALLSGLLLLTPPFMNSDASTYSSTRRARPTTRRSGR